MSTMYNSLIILIKSKNYDEEDIAKKADMYLLKNRITEDEYNQIYAMIQGKKEETKATTTKGEGEEDAS